MLGRIYFLAITLVLKVALVLVVVMGAMALLVRLLEPRLAFVPAVGETLTPREFGVAFETRTFQTQDGERLHAWMIPATAPRAYVVYFHGNGGNLSVWAPVLAGVAQRGYAVLAFDYRGYGRSTGTPSEQGLYRDVDAVIAARWNDSPREIPLVYWGRSLGGVMAAYAAGVREPDGVILESAFPDATSLLREAAPLLRLLAVFSSYRFPCAEFLQHVRAPILVMHGDADRVVPFSLGHALFERVAGPKRFVTLRGADHNDLAPSEPDAYWRAVDGFVATLLPARRR